MPRRKLVIFETFTPDPARCAQGLLKLCMLPVSMRDI